MRRLIVLAVTAIMAAAAAETAAAQARLTINDGSGRLVAHIDFQRTDAERTAFSVRAGKDWGTPKVQRGVLEADGTGRLAELERLAAGIAPDPTIEELRGEPDVICLHPWIIDLTAPGLAAETGRASCPANPFFNQAFDLGVEVLKALHPCDRLDANQHGNRLGVIARCTLLDGDLDQATGLANAAFSEVLLSPDEHERSELAVLFDPAAELRFPGIGRIRGGETATDFWRARVAGRVVENVRAGGGSGTVTGWVRAGPDRVDFVERWRLTPDGWRMHRFVGELRPG